MPIFLCYDYGSDCNDPRPSQADALGTGGLTSPLFLFRRDIPPHPAYNQGMNLTTNSPAPDFSAPDQEGKTHTLAEYAGKWVLLYFYPKDDTPGCTIEACNFRDAMTELQEDVVVLGVSADDTVSHQNFAQKYSLNFPLLADPEKNILTAYGANGIIFNKRVSFLINPQGIIAKIYDKVNVKKHAQEILKDVKNLSK